MDIQLSYQLLTPFNIYLRGENLTNNLEQQVYGWAVPGVAVYGGFKWSFW